MNYTTSTRSLLETDSDCLCLPIFDDKTLCSAGINVDEQLGKYISTSIERFDISGEIGKAFTLLTDDKTFSRIILLGFGKKNEDLNKHFKFILEENIDEIYCSLSSLSQSQIKEIVDFSENNLKTIKFVPSFENLYSKKLKYETYDFVPVLSLRNILLEEPFNKSVKRVFDILFSLFVVCCVLSWLIPLLAIIIKAESNGPIFFKQERNGYNFKRFYCYKFRSMKINSEADSMQATKNDKRLTKVGAFLRKTSIDEFPQFFNVLAGNMSVVGPRPHMIKENEKYLKTIDKFMVRHFIKPGITGLAQVNGYRGEIESNSDIVNRIKFDINYIENWSLLLDLKIIILTLFNSFKGEKKAY